MKRLKIIILLVSILLFLSIVSYKIGYEIGEFLGNDLTQQVEQLRQEQEMLWGR